MIDSNTESALFENAIPANSEIARLESMDIANINIPTGQLVACDPLTCWQVTPFAKQTMTGAYTVEALIAHYDSGDQRIAAASLKFNSERPARWEIAVTAEQDPDSLSDGEIFGYGVDSGTGCFMDFEAGQQLLERMEENDGYFEHMISEMDETYVHTRSWATIRPFQGYEISIFSSGVGDGFYPSYWGFGPDSAICRLTTDFGLLGALD